MKILVLGMMIASVSLSFAQADEAPTHQLKKRFVAKKKMQVEPATMNVEKNTDEQQNVNRYVEASGVVYIINGEAIIYSNEKNISRRLKPMNLPKELAIDGQPIQFNYAFSNEKTTFDGSTVGLIKLDGVSAALK